MATGLRCANLAIRFLFGGSIGGGSEMHPSGVWGTGQLRTPLRLGDRAAGTQVCTPLGLGAGGAGAQVRSHGHPFSVVLASDRSGVEAGKARWDMAGRGRPH
jgi:hypothetical protein